MSNINGNSAPYRGWQSPNYAFDKRAGQVARGRAARVQDYDQPGEAEIAMPTTGGDINGLVTGETLVQVTFPFTFIEKPNFTFGYELGVNQPATSGQFPQLTAGVHAWTGKSAGYTALYTGATIGVAATAPLGMRLIVHYLFKGKAMTGLSAAYNDTGTA